MAPNADFVGFVVEENPTVLSPNAGDACISFPLWHIKHKGGTLRRSATKSPQLNCLLNIVGENLNATLSHYVDDDVKMLLVM